MAAILAGSLPLLGRLRAAPADSTAVQGSVSFPFVSSGRGRVRALSIRAAATAVPTAPDSSPVSISLTDKALNHLTKLRAEKNEDLCLRIGVKQGGCSGMSYIMEFENRSDAKEDDSVIEYDGFAIVCDPKSLLFLYGMQLDFSDALMGGGFTFKNPNATKTCGCGKSFAAGARDGMDTMESNCGTGSCDS